MAVSPYGLSIVLDFEDNASDGMSKAAKTFSSLSGSADALTMGFNGTASSLNSLLNMNTSVVGMSVMGSQLQNMGEGVLGTLKSVADQVIDTGSVFENFKITLDALYKDEERAAEVTNDLFKFATKSPFEVEDLQGMVVTLKSMGLEAFDEVTNSISGAHQKTMDWIGDLQAFRPGYTAQQWKFAIQNFLSGSDTRSAMRLRNLLDIGDLSQYLGHSLGTTVQGRMQDLMEIVEKTGMFGMQEKLMNTWSVVLSNMNDAWTFFTYRIGYGIDKGSNNMYDSATKSARNLLFSMNEIFDNEGTIKSVSEALYGLVHPIERITQVARILSPTFADWLGQHPKVAKMTTAITALGGAGIYAVGSLLKLSAGALNWLLNVQRLGGLAGIFQLLSNSLSILSYKMIGIGAVGGLVYMAWKSDFMGLRTLLTNFSSQGGDILTKTYNDVLDGKSLTQSLNEQGLDKFVSGINAVKEAVNGLGQSFREGVSGFFKLFGFNIQSLNDKTFNLKNTLNDFGDALTQKFTGNSLDEFKEKYSEVLDTVGKVSGALMTSIGVTTLLGGAFRLLSGTASMFGTNLKIIASTLFSPVGLLGAGLTTLVLGYEKNFLGLQSTVTPIVDGIRAKMKSLKESFGQKDAEGNNTILSTITAKMKQLNEASKTWSFGGSTEQQGKSIGEVLAQGIASGLIAFGSPIQKAMGVLMYGWALNLGNIQQGAGSFVSQLINAKNLLLEMSTGYGQKSRALAEQFGLQDFADGIVRLKDTTTSFLKNFVSGFAKSNTIVGNFVKELFPDFDLSLNGILNAFGRLGTKISQFFGLGDTKDVAKNWANIAQKIGEIASKAMLLLPIFGALKTAWGVGISPLALSGISQSFGLIQSGMAQTISSIVSGFGKMFTSLTSFGSKAFSFLKFSLQSALLQDGRGSSIFGGLNRSFSNFRNQFRDALGSMSKDYVGFMQNLRRTSALNQLLNFESLRQQFRGIFTGAVTVDSFRDFFDSFKKVFTYNNSTFSETMARFKSDFLKELTMVRDDGTSLLEDLSDSLNNALESFATNAIGFVAKIAMAYQSIKWSIGLEVLKSGIEMFMSSLAGAVKMVIGFSGVVTGLAAISSLVLAFGTLTTSDWKELTEVIKGQETAITKLGVAWDWFNGKLAGTTARVNEFIQKFNVANLTEKVFDFVGTLGDSLSSIVAGTNNNGLADLAGHLIDSFVSGLSKGTSRIGQNIQKILTSVTATIKKYAPSIGRNMGNIVADIVKFIGDNSGDVIEAALTIMESFVRSLVANKGKIVNGAMDIVDSLCQGIIRHAPAIIDGVTSIIDSLVNALSIREKELGQAANAIITPIWECISRNGQKLWDLAKEVIGGLMDIIVGEISTGIAKVLAVVGVVSGIFAGIFYQLSVAAMSNPLTAALAPGLALTATKLGVVTAGLEVSAAALGIFGTAMKSSSRANVDFNSSVSRLKGSVGSLGSGLSSTSSGLSSMSSGLSSTTSYMSAFSGSIGVVNRDLEEQNGLIKENTKLLQENGDASPEVSSEKKTLKENNEYLEARTELLKSYARAGSWYLNNSDGTSVEISGQDQATLEQLSKGGNILYTAHIQDDGSVQEVAGTVQKLVDENGNTYYGYVEFDVGDGTYEEIVSRVEMWDGKKVLVYYEADDTEFNNPLDKIEIEANEAGSKAGEEFVQALSGKIEDGQQKINEIAEELTYLNKLRESMPEGIGLNVFDTLGGIFVTDRDGQVTVIDDIDAYISQLDERITTLRGKKDEVLQAMNELYASFGQAPFTMTWGSTGASEILSDYTGFDPNYFTPLSFKLTVETEGTEQATQEVDSFKGDISEIPNLVNTKITQNGAEESTNKVNGLFNAENSLYNKEIQAKANVFGKPEVDALKSSVDSLHSKTITITTALKTENIGEIGSATSLAGWNVKKNTGERAGGGLVSLNEAHTLMNEQGGEIVDLPAGSRVYPHDESVAMSYKDGFNDSFAKTAKLIKDSAVSQTPSYTTADNSSHDKYDYSVNFGQGSIVVKVDNAKGDTDYKAAAEKIWYYIEQKQRRNIMARRS